MKAQIYDAILRLFKEMDYNLSITVGDITLRLYDPQKDDPSIWERGITANGWVYDLNYLAEEHLGPSTYAELFTGEYDIISGFVELILR